MSCNSCCSNTSNIWIEVLISLILGAAVGVLYAFGFVTAVATGIWILLGLAVLNMIFLIAGLFTASIFRRTPLSRCLICKGGIYLVGIIGTIVMALVLLSITIVVSDLIAAFVALLVFFAALMGVESVLFLKCIICELFPWHRE